MALVQEIPGQKQAENALDTLVGQGVMGSYCVLLTIALFFAIRALLKAKDDRFADQKLMTESLQKMNELAKELALEMNRVASNLVIESTKTNDHVRTALNSQEKAMDDVVKELMELRIASEIRNGRRP